MKRGQHARGGALAGAVLAAAVLAALAPLAHGQGAAPAAAGACAVCHGPKGISTVPETPNLAGQPQGYLVAQLKAFREGTRRHEVMAVIAKGLGDADIETLSRWYASIQIEAKAPSP